MVGREAPSKPKPEVIEGVEEYEIEHIIAERVRYGKKEYLVKWIGYDSSDNTWVKRKDLYNATNTIKLWDKSQQNKNNVQRKNHASGTTHKKKGV